jgi:uncharacterized protein YprB with RNaseH-like and TPR domain
VNIDTQRFLRLVEQAHTLCTFDIEATGLKGDYNSILCVSIRPYHRKPITFAIEKAGRDRDVVEQAAKELRKYDVWVSYFGKGFDFPMINTRLLKWGLAPLERKLHIDMYFTLKSHLLTARRSQAHLLEWLDVPEKKMTISADEWNKVLESPREAMPTMIKRCESDVKGLEGLYDRTCHLVGDLKA